MPDLFAEPSTDDTQQQQTVDTTTTQPQGDGNVSTQTVDTTSQTQDSSWLDFVPEEYREAGWLTRHQSKEEFFKSMANAQSMLGRKNGIPDFENDSPEVINEFRRQLGIPETPDGYEIELPEQFDKENPEYKNFLETMHKAHVPKDMANEIYQMGIQEVQKAIEAYTAEQDKAIDESFAEFAKNPRFQEISVNVKQLLSKVDPNGEILTADDMSELGVNAPKVALLLDKIATMTGDDKVIGLDSGNSTLAQGTREEQVRKVFADFESGRISEATMLARQAEINRVYGVE